MIPFLTNMRFKLLGSVLIISTFMACKYDLAVPVIQMSPEYSTAIGKFNFVFSDFLKGDALLKLGQDSSISLRYVKDSLVSYTAADLVGNATAGLGVNIQQTTPIGAFRIADVTAAQPTELSQLKTVVASPLDDLFENGGTVTDPPFSATGTGNFTTTGTVVSNFAPLREFMRAELLAGTLQFQLVNNFPFDVNNLTVELLNTATDAVLLTFPIQNNTGGSQIAAGATGSATVNLTGKTLVNELSYRMSTFSSSGMALGTVVSPTATLAATMNLTNLRLKTGISKLPAQSLTGNTIQTNLTTANPNQKWSELVFKTAELNYTISKTTQANLAVTLTFPTILDNGVPVTKIIEVTESVNAGSIPLSKTVANLASNAAQPYNQLPMMVGLSVLSSGGGFVSVATADAVTIEASLGDISVSSAKGQFGNLSLAVPNLEQDLGAGFDYLNEESKRLLFSDPVMRLKTENSFGFPMKVSMLMKAKGTLPGTEYLGKDSANYVQFNIARPNVSAMGTAAQLVTGVKELNKNTSNIVNFMGILPKKLSVSGHVLIPSLGQQTDFFTADSRIKIGLEMDIPIKFSTENLIVRDTTTKFSGVATAEQLQSLDYAALDVQYQTRLPLSITVDLMAMQADSSLVPVSTGIVLPATDAMDATGKVTGSKSGRFDVKLTKEQLLQLTSAEKTVFVAKLKTAGNGTTPVAIYTHYDFSMGIGLRLKMNIK